ncbi:MAG: hypothetical protein ABSB35_42010 [Bryobacteraceae bacterium]|jgi:hypothetical protein
MKQICFGPWTLRADAEATRRAYERTEQGSAEGCVCDACKNFVIVRDEAYPPEVLNLFETVGIDYRKETELSHYWGLPSGLQLYSGWFYFAGQVAGGPESWTYIRSTSRQAQLHRLTPRFEIGFTQMEKRSQHFSEFPSVQVDFCVELPWRSDAPEPD